MTHNNDNNDNILFAVFGLRLTRKGHDTPIANLEILGVFDNPDDAIVFKEIHQDWDTTLEGVSIASVDFMDSVPDMEVMLAVEADIGNNTISVKSTCVPTDKEPLLIEEDDYFYSLAWIEDKENIVNYACSWLESKTKIRPKVIEDIPDSVEDYA